MTEEEHDRNDERSREAQESSGEDSSRPSGNSPEPPLSYDSRQGFNAQPRAGANAGSDANLLRRMISAAQIMALVSLVIGGVVLSSVSVIVGVMAYRKASSGAMRAELMSDHGAASLKRSAAVALVLAVAALAVNVIALIALYPMIAEMLQTGDYATLLNPAGPTEGSSSSFWG